MDARSSRKQREGKFSRYGRRFSQSHVIVLFLQALLSVTLVESAYMLSKDCTKISLKGRRIRVIEGKPFNFTLQPYIVDCDNPGCKMYYDGVLVCDTNPNCKSCSTYKGPFSPDRIQVGIWLLSDINIRAPGSTCSIGSTPTVTVRGSYPVSCVIKNNYASNVYQYLLRAVVIDNTKPKDLGSPADLLAMIGSGATIMVAAGEIDPDASSIFWADSSNIYYPGDRIKLSVSPRDKFGNLVSEKTGRTDLSYPWNVTVVNLGTNVTSYPNFDVFIDRSGHHNVTFVADQPGPQKVYIVSNGKIFGHSALPFTVVTGSLYLPLCQGNWLDDKHTFISGTIAKFRLKVVDKFNTPLGSSIALQYSIRIYDEAGNLDLHPQLNLQNEAEPGFVLIEFRTAKAGRHYIFIGNNTFYVPGSPFSYDVFVGQVSIPHCVGRLTPANPKAGSVIILNITLFDPSQNLVKRLSYVEFSVSIRLFDREFTSPTIVKDGETSTGYQAISFYPTLAGKYSMNVGYKREFISNSPFYFTVLPGPFSVAHSTVIEHSDFMNAVAGSPITLAVQQKDTYGNAFTSGTKYDFRVTAFQIIKGGRSFVVPRVSASYDRKLGIQFLNVVLGRAGNCYLEIGSTAENISGSPFPVKVKAGALTMSACIGFWVSKTITAGSLAHFTVIYMDSFGNNVSVATGSEETISTNANVSLSKDLIIGLSNVDVQIVTLTGLGIANFYFNITTAGEYYLHILGSLPGKMVALGRSPFFFKVNPDVLMPAACSFPWSSNISYRAGDQVVAMLFLKDRFNNSVILTQNELMMLQITIYRASTSEMMTLVDANILTRIEENTIKISFFSKQSGTFQLSITDIYGTSISASPYLFSVVPGPVVIKNCSGQWQNNTEIVEEGSLAEFIIKERDAFGNVVCRNITRGEKQLVFKARILGIEKTYVSGFEFKAVVGKSDDILCGQLLTFPVLLYNLGQYRLEIKSGNQSIHGSPYPFNVVEGPVSSSLSTFEGPGLDVSPCGKLTYYIMTLRDDKGVPKGSHLGSLSVEILEFNKMIQIKPKITAVPNSRGMFNVTYLPTIAGAYVIMTRWLGVQVGEAHYMTVTSGAVSAVNCTGMWENKIVNVEAGQFAKFIISQRDMYGNAVFSKNSSDLVSFTAQVLKASDRQPVYTSVMSFQPWGDIPTESQVLTFQIWEEGSHFLQIKCGGENIYGSPFVFTCTHGPVALPECSGEWQDGIHSFLVGETAKFLIYCTQDVSATNYNFNPLKFQGTIWDNSVVLTVDMSIEKMVTESMGSQLLRFSPQKSGTFLLYVQNVVKKRLTGSPFRFTVKEGSISMKHCRGKWMMGISTFEVGAAILFVIKQSDIYGNAVYDPYLFTVKVVQSDTMLPVTTSGGFLRPLFKNKTEYMLLNVTVKEIGNFSLYIGNSSVDISGSPFPFSCTPGSLAANNTGVVGDGLSPLASINFWNEIIVYMRDIYNNILPINNMSLSLNVTEGGTLGMEAYDILPITNALMSPNVTGSAVAIDGFKPNSDGGYRAAYRPYITGNYYISIYLNGSTLQINSSNVAVGEGWIQARFCTATFKPSSTVIAGEIMQVYITARDPLGKSVSYTTQPVNFSVTPLPVGIAVPKSVNTEIYNASQGLYIANFSIKSVGTYKVEIAAYGSQINGSSFMIKVVPGPISPLHCILNTPEFSNIKVGAVERVEVEARDVLGNTINGTDLEIQDAHFVADVIGSKVHTFNLSYIGNGVYGVNLSWNMLGSYNLSINYGGQSINMKTMVINVVANDVDPLKCAYFMSTSDRILIGTYGVITIQAKDSFGNNCSSGGKGFVVDLINVKASVIYSGVPFDADDGKYLFPFRLETDGTYYINITYKGIQIPGQKELVVLKGSTEAVSISHVTPTLLPVREHTSITLFGQNLMQIISFSCNFGDIETQSGTFNTTQETLKCETPYIDAAVNVRLAVQLILYQGKSTFNFDLSFYVASKPIAIKDEVWSWINKFVSFNPLLNDYVSYGLPKLAGVCKGPFYGKVEVVGSSLVYTPNVNFTGIDNLIYTIVDFKGQLAYADVIISVFTNVPQFVSKPQVLIGMEDQPVPSQRGIQGLEIISPNIDETLEIEVLAEHGHIYFAPDLPQLWQGVQVLSFDNQDVSMSNSSKSALVFTGSFTVVSTAIQALRYLGEPLFNGNDIISLQMLNKKQEGSKTSILVMLQAKNNPPFINISSCDIFFNASYWKTHNELPISTIGVGDPDEIDVLGTSNELQLKITIEISSQSLKIALRSTFLNDDSTVWYNPGEEKLKDNKRTITGQKIEFQDSIQSCNDALKSLHVIITNPKGLRNALVTITVNDLGSFGCTEDCTLNTTSPLQDIERILINFEYIPPDMRAKIASALTCPLVLILYMTLLIFRYRRSLSYDYDDGSLSENDMLKKTRVFNPMWSKEDVKEESDDSLSPQNEELHMANPFEEPVLQDDALFDEAVTLDRHNSEYLYSNENKGSMHRHATKKNIFLINDS